MFIAVLSEIYIGVQESNTQAWEIYINNVMIDVSLCSLLPHLTESYF